jgi:heme exporter protein D
MMPDLGKYAVYVNSAYIASLVLIAGLVWLSLRGGAKTLAELRRVENRRELDDE